MGIGQGESQGLFEVLGAEGAKEPSAVVAAGEGPAFNFLALGGPGFGRGEGGMRPLEIDEGGPLVVGQQEGCCGLVWGCFVTI